MAAKILVVDDDPNVQRLLQYTLKQEGYDVVIASDGTEGFRMWDAEAPDLILLDVMLPKLDGYQVAAKIRAEEGPATHVPIIMLTAEREVEQKVRGLRAGADDYLIKPFHPAELMARIKSLLARFAPRDALVGRPPLGRVRGLYDYILIDIDKRLDDVNLGVLEASETMFVVMTADLSCLKNVRLVLETIGHLGYEAAKIQLVLNRSNAFTGINVKNAEGALKRTIDHQIVNEYRGAISALNTGAPFMLTKADSLLGRSMLEFARVVDKQPIPVGHAALART